MALTRDQKKHFLIGGGALAVVAGYYLLRGHRAHADTIPVGRHRAHYRRHHWRHHQALQDQGVEIDNARGEYGHRKHKHHHHGELGV